MYLVTIKLQVECGGQRRYFVHAKPCNAAASPTCPLPAAPLCPQCCSLAADAVLKTTHYLFCTPDCETKHYLKASSGAIRRALGKLERGVCTMCGLDCRALVAQMQCIRVSSKDWQAKRCGRGASGCL